MIDFGTVKPGTTLYIPFATYDSNDPTASVTMTGLAVTDIEIYKDGGTTQRASDSGYALLDTDGIDFDSLTGIHGFSIDLADNTTSGFYVAGSQYWVVVSSITVDSGTVSFIAATFRIGYPDAAINTTIATLASQTSFTLTAGPAEDDALNGCVCIIHDIASAVQMGLAVISDYTGSTKTVTLAAGTTFTAAAGDNISIFPAVNPMWIAGGATAAANLKTACDNYSATRGLSGTALPAAAADAAGGLIISDAGGLDADAVKNNVAAILADTGTDGVVVASIANNAITAAAIATGAIDADALAADAVAEIADGVWDEALAGHAGAGSAGEALSAAGTAGDPWTTALPGAYGAGTAGKIIGDNLNATVGSRATQTSVDTIDDFLDTEVAAILADTNELQTDLTNGGRLDLLIDSIITHLTDIKGAGWATETLVAIAAFVDTLETRLTAARAGYLDNLSAGAVPTAAQIKTAMEAAGSHLALILEDTGTTIQAELDGIQADTEDLQTQIGAAGAGLSAVPWNAAWDAQVQSEVDDALDAAFDDVASLTAGGIKDRLRKLTWRLWNKDRVNKTASPDQYEVYKDDGTTVARAWNLTEDANEAKREVA